MARPRSVDPTRREMQALKLISEGKRYEDAGRLMNASRGSVARLLYNAVERIGAEHTAHAIAMLIRQGKLKCLAGALLAAALALGVAAQADAQQPCAWLSVTVASKHINPKPGKDYNEENWGIGREDCIAQALGFELRGGAGFFRNSNRVDSFYFGGSATTQVYGPLRLGAAALLVAGYEVDAIPALLPVAAIEGDRLGANVSYIPRTKTNGAAVGFQLKWRWR